MTDTTFRRPRAAIMTAAAALSLLGGYGAISSSPVLAQDGEVQFAQCEIPADDLSVADVAERVNPAVVTLTNLQAGGGIEALPGIGEIPGIGDIPGMPVDPGQGEAPGGAMPVGTGSGFIVDEAGHVVTNAHVVDGSDKLRAMFEDGTQVDATLVGKDDLLDIAVVKLEMPAGKELPGVACFGDTETLRPGDQVVAIGSALGEFTNTVTEGTVNAKGRDLDGYGLNSLIQHDAEIWHGNSGGPLLNLKGEVIGVNAAGISSDQMGTAPADIAFAIDGNAAKDVVSQLIEDGSVDRPFLGIQGQPLPLGHMIDDVVAGSGADDAGIMPGDIIVSIDGQPITRKATLLDTLLSKETGDTIAVVVDRDGEQMTFDVTLGERPADAN